MDVNCICLCGCSVVDLGTGKFWQPSYPTQCTHTYPAVGARPNKSEPSTTHRDGERDTGTSTERVRRERGKEESGRRTAEKSHGATERE